jgi:hypothetical protein
MNIFEKISEFFVEGFRNIMKLLGVNIQNDDSFPDEFWDAMKSQFGNDDSKLPDEPPISGNNQDIPESIDTEKLQRFFEKSDSKSTFVKEYLDGCPSGGTVQEYLAWCRAKRLRKLDQVSIPSDAEFDEWLSTISIGSKDHKLMQDTMQQLMSIGKDGRKFLAMVRYLNLTYPDQTIEEHVATAKQAIAPLAARFTGVEEPEWTERELDSWLETLEDGYKSQIMEMARNHKLRNGSERGFLLGLCAARRKIEQFQAARTEREAQAAEDNKISWLHHIYIWNEESRKVDQHHAAQEAIKFFDAQKRKDRGY